MLYAVCREIQMLHRTVKYDVQEVEPSRWRWIIHPGDRVVRGLDNYRSRELAVESCLREINDGIERTVRKLRNPRQP